MAEISGHTFTWKIENASYCWMQKDEYLASPTFVVEELNNTSWLLRLYPRKNGCMVSLGIERNPDCKGPRHIALSFQIGFLNEAGEVKNNVDWRCGFEAGTYSGSCGVSRYQIFSEKSEYLYNDTLTIRCRMSKVHDVFFQTAFKVARTTIKVEKRSGLLVIEHFASQLAYHEEVDVDFRYGLNKFMTAAFYSPEGWNEICGFKLKYLKQDLKYIFIKVFILNADHTMINCCELEQCVEVVDESRHFNLPMNKKFLTDIQNNFLHEGSLYFHFQCTYTTGISLNEIEEAGVAYIPPSFHHHIASSNDISTKELFSSSLKNELMQNDSFNVDIGTIGKQFKAHIDILSANSPVFHEWFQDSLAEDGNALLKFEDMDCVTMSRMLSFVYTGRFITDDLEYESCVSLYKAACRYKIINLRSECTNFFINNMSMHALPLLSFAEAHHDQDLVRFLQQYIASHKKDIFSVD